MILIILVWVVVIWSVSLASPPSVSFLPSQLWWLQTSPTWCEKTTEGLLSVSSCSLCHSSVTEWKATRLLRLFTPSPLTCPSVRLVCGLCLLHRMSRLHRASSPVYPPSVCSPIKHIHIKHTHQMLACQYKDTHGSLHSNIHPNRHTTFRRTDNLHKTLLFRLSALHSKLRYLFICPFKWIYSCQLNYIRLIFVCV